ncbi:hypothetical protein DFH11DRAFT_1876448 [Phellopilus nigrolimitatus]|nr:hypothetical protein DFH11DRAFT_1876448 [Phellopilus nigrolimitatus]
MLHRESPRADELDRQIIRGMSGFEFGTEDEIEHKLGTCAARARFAALFAADRAVHFNYHGLWGTIDEGTMTTPFCMMLANGVSRYHVAAAEVRTGAELNERVAVDAQTKIGELMHHTRKASECPLEHSQDEYDAAFKPSMAEFTDFDGYMIRVECRVMRSGIVKNPAKGVVQSTALQFRAPAIDKVGLNAAGEYAHRTLRRSKRGVGSDETEEEVEVEVDGVVVREVEEDEQGLVAEHDHSEDVLDADTSLPTSSVDADANVDEPEESIPPPRKRCIQTRVEREAGLSKRTELDKTFLQTFDGHWLPRNTSAADYTPAFCATLERKSWRNYDPVERRRPPSTLSHHLPVCANGLPGDNTPYLYFWMWRATFVWLIEDMNFLINYIHFGVPKFWYAIPQARSVQFENTLRSFFPQDVAQCRKLTRWRLRGERQLRFGSWLDNGRQAQVCGCIRDSVRVDVDTLLREREEEASKPLSKASFEKPKPLQDKEDQAEPSADSEDLSAIRQKLKLPKNLGRFPCCLCVSQDLVGLLRVHDQPSAWANCHNYQPKDMDRHEAWRAHESCAMIVPVDEFAVQDQDEMKQAVERMEKVVFGVDAIVKDRWALKCTAYQKGRAKSHGAPIQCTKGKCPKTSPVSCARGGGVEARIHFAELRVSAGVFEVSLVAVNEERSTVEVVWDNEMKSEFEWSSIVWGKMEGQMVGQKPTNCCANARTTIACDECPDANSQVQNLDAGRPRGAPAIFLRQA